MTPKSFTQFHIFSSALIQSLRPASVQSRQNELPDGNMPIEQVHLIYNNMTPSSSTGFHNQEGR